MVGNIPNNHYNFNNEFLKTFLTNLYFCNSKKTTKYLHKTLFHFPLLSHKLSKTFFHFPLLSHQPNNSYPQNNKTIFFQQFLMHLTTTIHHIYRHKIIKQLNKTFHFPTLSPQPNRSTKKNCLYEVCTNLSRLQSKTISMVSPWMQYQQQFCLEHNIHCYGSWKKPYANLCHCTLPP